MKCNRCGAEVRAFVSVGGRETVVDYSKVTYNKGTLPLINDDGSTNPLPKLGDRGYIVHDPACGSPFRHRNRS